MVSLVDMHYTMEEYMDGEWAKWITNAGGTPTRRLSATAAQYSPLIMAFCHYTYHRTGGKLLVSDVQVRVCAQGRCSSMVQYRASLQTWCACTGASLRILI